MLCAVKRNRDFVDAPDGCASFDLVEMEGDTA